MHLFWGDSIGENSYGSWFPIEPLLLSITVHLSVICLLLRLELNVAQSLDLIDRSFVPNVNGHAILRT